MDTNIALAGLASGMAVLIGAECGRGVHDTPPGCAWKHCHEKYVWTPVCFTTSPHHGLVQSYQAYGVKKKMTRSAWKRRMFNEPSAVCSASTCAQPALAEPRQGWEQCLDHLLG